jgi:hypothetical protein
LIPLSTLAPFFLCLVPLFFSGSHTVGMVGWQDWIRPGLIALGTTGILLLALRLRLGCLRRASLVTTFLIALFLWPRPLEWTFFLLESLGLPLVVAGGLTGLSWLLVTGMFGSWALGLEPEDPRLEKLGDFALAFSFLLLLAGGGEVWRFASMLNTTPLPLAHQESLQGHRPDPAPDIYWIVLDAYPRRDILQSVFHLDNSKFYRALEERGFTLSHASSSNYATTAISLASALNLDYLAPSRERPVDSDQAYFAPLTAMVRDNRLTQFLAQQGYRTVSLSSGAYLMEHGNFQERHAGRWSSLEYLLLGNTLADLFTTEAQFTAHRRSLKQVLELLPTLARDSQPVFALAHVAAPHPPFVLGPDGEAADAGYPRYTPLDYGGVFDFHMGSGWYQRHLRDQVLGVNHLVLRALDAILARRDRPAVILLHGDHGSASKRTKLASTEDVRERYAILLALRFPGGSSSSLYPGMSLVNAGRMVLNRVFESHLPLLPDRTFSSGAEPGFGLREIPPARLRPLAEKW